MNCCLKLATWNQQPPPNALGIEAASFASFENGFWGRGRNEVTEPVEVPRSNLGSETGT